MGDVFERKAWDLGFAGRAERTRKVYLFADDAQLNHAQTRRGHGYIVNA